MKKIDLPLIADVAFYSVAVWFLSLGILRYFRMQFSLAVVLACLFALAAGGIVFLIEYTRHRRRALSRKEREKRDKLLLHLALEREERVRASILSAFAADGSEAHLEGDALKADGEIYIPRFSMQPVSADAIARLIREYGSTPFTVVCNELSPEAEKLLAPFGLKALRGDDVYALFERTQTTPAQLICGEIPRRSVRQRLRLSFSKKNARPFFVSGLLLLVMSLFTFFPLYYLISGTLLMLCAVTVRIFGYAN